MLRSTGLAASHLALSLCFVCWLCARCEAKTNNQELSDSGARKLYVQARNSLDFDDALKHWNRLVEFKPSEYQGERGKFFAKHGDFLSAHRDFEEAARLSPQVWLSRKAFFLVERGNFDGALQDVNSLINLRNSERHTKDKHEAIVAVTRLAQAYADRASIYEKQGKLNEALEDFLLASKLNAHFFLPACAAFCKRANFEAEELKALNQLVELYPNAFLPARAELLEKQGQSELARQDLDALVKLSPKLSSHEGYSPLAWALHRRSEYFYRRGLNKLAEDDLVQSRNFEKQQNAKFGTSKYPRSE